MEQVYLVLLPIIFVLITQILVEPENPRELKQLLKTSTCYKCGGGTFSDMSCNHNFSAGEQEFLIRFDCDDCGKQYKATKYWISDKNKDICVDYTKILFSISYTKYNLGNTAAGSFSGAPKHLRKHPEVSRKG